MIWVRCKWNNHVIPKKKKIPVGTQWIPVSFLQSQQGKNVKLGMNVIWRTIVKIILVLSQNHTEGSMLRNLLQSLAHQHLKQVGILLLFPSETQLYTLTLPHHWRGGNTSPDAFHWVSYLPLLFLSYTYEIDMQIHEAMRYVLLSHIQGVYKILQWSDTSFSDLVD